jgi:hypothetical protein
MRLRLLALSCALVLVPLLGACGSGSSSSPSVPTEPKPTSKPSKAFCQAAYDYDNKVVVANEKDGRVKIARQQLPYVVRMQKAAADDVKADIALMVSGYEGVIAGHTPTADTSARYEYASKRVERYANDGCQLLNQNQSGGNSI